jgi:hypothetical protein
MEEEEMVRDQVENRIEECINNMKVRIEECVNNMKG